MENGFWKRSNPGWMATLFVNTLKGFKTVAHKTFQTDERFFKNLNAYLPTSFQLNNRAPKILKGVLLILLHWKHTILFWMTMEMLIDLLNLVWLKNYINIFSHTSQNKEITVLTAPTRKDSWTMGNKVGSKYHIKCGQQKQ